ncbi:Subtilisin-like protease [Quillaja saponaria]|uniref:Subtilisin-like protease n=1 Tax=Quillaja saponaria TaxID=32244 RepID=A0AAD7PLA3_QUISA|nr:Subtilisin-like protease [Quillaja saponaria]
MNTIEPPDVFFIQDTSRHGTCCAAIIAGNIVPADFFNLKHGRARGGVTGSRIASYKVGTTDSDLDFGYATSKAISTATEDGVDILSISGSIRIIDEQTDKKRRPHSYMEDQISIGTVYPTLKGILCCLSAGNIGGIGSVGNGAPWALCVGACNSKTTFSTKVNLGGRRLPVKGFSINTFERTGLCPPILAINGKIHRSGPLDPKKVAGKIVVHKTVTNGRDAKVARAKGIIIIDSCDSRSFYEVFPLPAAKVTKKDVERILNYMKELSESAKAEILTSEQAVNKKNEFPVLSSHSSKGPSRYTEHFIVPYVCAPGDELLSESPETVSASKLDCDDRRSRYTIISDTSFATAVVSSVAAYVKSVHKSWSAAAIKSASMTTGTQPILEKNANDVYGIGNGMINPIGAADPGLVYDIDRIHYARLLLGLEDFEGEKAIQAFFDRDEIISVGESIPPWDFNLPSLGISIPNTQSTCVFNRTVKNVGKGGLPVTYTAEVSVPESPQVTVTPKKLIFKEYNEEKTLKVKVVVTDWRQAKANAFSGVLAWKSLRRNYRVRSQILIKIRKDD